MCNTPFIPLITSLFLCLWFFERLQKMHHLLNSLYVEYRSYYSPNSCLTWRAAYRLASQYIQSISKQQGLLKCISASPPSLIAYRCRPTAGTVHLKSSQKLGPISESGGSDGSRLSVFICCIPSCAYSLFFPPRHKNINFQPGVAANFLHLTAHSVHHRDCFRQGSGSVSQRKELLIQFFFLEVSRLMD